MAHLSAAAAPASTVPSVKDWLILAGAPPARTAVRQLFFFSSVFFFFFCCLSILSERGCWLRIAQANVCMATPTRLVMCTIQRSRSATPCQTRQALLAQRSFVAAWLPFKDMVGSTLCRWTTTAATALAPVLKELRANVLLDLL